ncbi:MAG TPA: RICIN domain-containing protein [Polyangiales bacterium]|nr:RICIN domain-containing protein [Polyangiales bacterium]
MEPRMTRTAWVIALVSCSLAACAADTGQLDEDEGENAVEPAALTQELKAGNVAALKNVKSGRCIGVDGASTANGAFIKQFTCDGAANQGWTLQAVTNNTFRLSNGKSHRCIGVDGGSHNAGANLRQFTCDSSANQQWLILSNANDVVFLNRGSDLCIGVDGASTANGAQLKQFECDERPNQRWVPQLR